ncbi:MAG: ribosome biogenesis GTPase Der [Proteobacteria bacterium]|nr:ribosome biogenesis GTPase Der [Pseudomonadota bacterium]
MKSQRSRLPVVALVGRPNVGKSRLFNRFVGARTAIVENTPGVTRDRNYGTAKWEEHRFTIIDTGGFEPESTDILLEQMRIQAQLAVEEADVILFVVDARSGVLPADWQIADILRKSSKRIILVVNKVDQPKLLHLEYEFYELALDEMVPVSAEHGFNFDELATLTTRDFPENLIEERRRQRFELDNDFGEFSQEYADALDESELDESESEDEEDEEAQDEEAFFYDDGEGTIPDFDQAEQAARDFETDEDVELYEVPSTPKDEGSLEARTLEETISVAVLGKPNTGKSTLINRLLGYKRLLTSDIAGTTRDSIDTELEGKDGQHFVLIDTAGIRRKSTISHRLEKFSIVKALDAVERADVVLLLVEAGTGITDQDLKIASIAVEKGCAVAVLLNKWDLIENKTDHTAKAYIKATRERLTFLQHVPIFTISALTGMRTHKVLDIAKKLYLQASMRVSTGELNRVFRRILDQHAPPAVGNRNLRFYFAQQVAIRPPTFVIQSNAPDIIPTDYKRFLTNQLRAYYRFDGTPIRILFKKPAGRRKWVTKKK